MTDQLDHIEPGDELSEVVEPAAATTSRRSFVSKGAIAAAVGAAAGIAMSQRASAADGDDLNLGDFSTTVTSNIASSTTGISGGSTFYVQSGNSRGDASIYGYSDAGDGVVGGGSRYDLYAAGTGIANLTAASPAIGATSTGAAGSIARNADGTLWYCYEANKWRKIAGDETGGAFHPVTPFRVYDSRKEADGKFTGGSNRTISVADSKDVDTYAVVTANAVPAGATAVVGNVVAIGTSDTGFLSINPGGTTAITAATVNWAAGMNIGNAGTFTLNSSRELEAVFGPGNGAHMTIDITGYYL